jgi:hypothetical protein
MNVIDIFRRFFISVRYVGQLLQNEGPYMIAMVITYVGLKKGYKWLI